MTVPVKARALSPMENLALNQREWREGKTTLESNPVRVSMNMTGNCNIRCVYCHLTYADYYSGEEFGLDLLDRVKGFLPTLSYLVYFSSTEPLAARHFKDVFRATMSYGAEKYVSTNGLLIDRELAELFVEGGLRYLTISVGGLTRASFEKAHQVDRLDALVENIERLNRIKKATGSELPGLRLVFVVWRDNADELPEAVRFAHRHAFSEGVKITYLKAYTDDMIGQIPFDCLDEVQVRVREAQSLGRELGAPVAFDGGNFDDFDEENVGGFHRPCAEPFERFHIEADGKVRTCPSFVNREFAGDLKAETAEEIWNGPVYRKFRERVNSDNPPDGCMRCTHNFHKDFRRRNVWDQRDLDLGIYNRLEGRSYLKGR
ncbi:MAG: hypothetical protein CMH76_00295 [Nitrospinae bacterium]|jgi:radical SAM protein with 4Fe4S-binding SPASM domain|nr:hypothetical protein [Nitrospinota bacterium]